jgi:hypothetical protein
VSVTDRPAFLAGVHLGDLDREGGRSTARHADLGAGGNLWVITGTDSLKSRHLPTAPLRPRAQNDDAPVYSYVSVEGPVVSVEWTDRTASTGSLPTATWLASSATSTP